MSKKPKIKKVKKVRVNGVGGKFVWVTPKKTNQIIIQRKKSAVKKQVKKNKKYSDVLGIPEKKLSKNIYDNLISKDLISEYISNFGNIRYKGRFISKEVQNKILEIAGKLDDENISYNLTELLSIPEIESKILIITSETGKDIFYWNIQGTLTRGDFGSPEIVIHDFDNVPMYLGKSIANAVKVALKLNRKLQHLEKVILAKEKKNPYWTIPVYDSKRDNQIIKIVIKYNEVKSTLPKHLHDYYRSQL